MNPNFTRVCELNVVEDDLHLEVWFLNAGHRCGYITVYKDHYPGVFKKLKDEMWVKSEIQAYGSVTHHHAENEFVRIGFDTGHVYDIPDNDFYRKYFGYEINLFFYPEGATVKTLDFVKEELNKIKERIKYLNSHPEELI